ncbi:YciI family protein [Nocardia sp. NPDC057668]|uniref:YciI family protein n=1 Tax=Nocardia sp. NPDC057668 TaxID=3346202 RepID=UPI00366DAA48
MRYMLLTTYAPAAFCDSPIEEWASEDISAHIDFQRALGQELAKSGELIEAQGLTGPEAARVVCSDGRSAPVVTDGPFVESKEFLAGYWVVDVDTAERALEIAARISAAPGPEGRPMGEYVEVREIASGPPNGDGA